MAHQNPNSSKRQRDIRAAARRIRHHPPQDWDQMLERDTPDPEIRAAAKRLLETEGETLDVESHLPRAPGDATTQHGHPTPELPTSVATDAIGKYRLLQKVGEGGFGMVYLAEQTEPVQRRVALKLIKPGMDSEAVIARFEAERQALALMDHPCIAKVLDAGLTDAHRPFFVMEYVAGEPVTRYCDRHKLSVDDRLEIFIRICEAVHHAHMKGIVHRDLKPANVLVSIVDERPSPKVIDFGVAKALHQRLSETPFVTEQGHMIGTPEYMSPEQAEMGALDVDTRADIYSLGVLLYELLTGMLPFDSESLRSASMAEIHRIIREVDPPKPSTKLSSVHDGQSGEVAKNRRLDRKSLSRNLRGDLDWIVMRAMEKDRTRRYESASAMAEDIRRHMLHEPVNAGPPSVSYKVTKFVRRHTSMVAASTVLTIAVLAGLTSTSILYAQAEAARQDADDERTAAIEAKNEESAARQEAVDAKEQAEASLDAVRQISKTYVVDLQDKIRNLRGSTPAKLLLVSSTLPALEELAPHYDDPELQATLADGFQLIGDLSVSLASEDASLTTKARESYRRALEIRRRQFRASPADPHLALAIASTLERLAYAEATVSNHEIALGLLDETREQTKKATALGAESGSALRTGISAMNVRGRILQRQEKIEEARRLHGEALTILENLNVGGPDEPWVRRALAHTLNDLGFCDAAQHRTAGAIQRYSRAMTIYREILEGDHLDARSSDDLGLLLERIGRVKLDDAEISPDEALPLIRESHATFLALWEDDPYAARSLEGIMRSMEAYGDYLVKNDRPFDALATYTQFLEISERLHAFNPMNYARTRALAIAHAKVGRLRYSTDDVGGGTRSIRQALETMKTLDAEAPGTADEVLISIAGFARNAARDLLVAGEFEQSIAPHDLAVEAYQVLGERRTDALTTDLGRTIRNRAWARYYGHVQGPEALADFELANTFDPRTETHIAAALECARVLAGINGAEADLERFIASLDATEDAKVIQNTTDWMAAHQELK